MPKFSRQPYFLCLRMINQAPPGEKIHCLRPGSKLRGLLERQLIAAHGPGVEIGKGIPAAWVEYQKSGTVCGQALPPGIQESEQFPEPLFTPTTKADVGHDENLAADQFIDLVGTEAANALRIRSLALYKYGADYALERGIIIADTKFEFGMLDGEPIVIDEILTPDSSRFWEASDHRVGRHQEAADKQYVRDYLLASESDRDHQPPGPELPQEVVDETSRRYRDIFKRLTGQDLQL